MFVILNLKNGKLLLTLKYLHLPITHQSIIKQTQPFACINNVVTINIL